MTGPSPAPSGPTIATVSILRSVLFGVLVFGLVGTEIELLLLEHTDGYWQLTPVVVFGVGLVVIVWWLIARGRASLRAFQAVMLLFVASGVAGTILHYNGNVAFELEMMPGLRGFELFGKAMMGATPALAPGVMIQLGLIGWLYTFRHPVLILPDQTLSRTSES